MPISLLTLRLLGLTLAMAAVPAAFARPAEAQPLPDPGGIATSREAAVVQRLYDLRAPGTAEASILPELDRILAELREPTPLRGLVQFLRAAALADTDRDREAAAAIEESIRLLPTYSGPLFLAARIEMYGRRPGMGADYFLRGARIDPAIARNVSDYDLSALVLRLRQLDESRRLLLLAERLFEIGWQGEDVVLRSGLARDLIRGRIESGDLSGARASLANLVVPGDARKLLIANRYEALWPALEQWVGPVQRRQWSLYLDEVRARWGASRDPEHAANYARALAEAGHYRRLAEEMAPILMGRLDRRRDYAFLWVASPVAEALSRLGRWDEADALFAHMLTTWPLGSESNALNLIANRARLRLMRGDSAAALSMIDASIADAVRYEGDVTIGAYAAMHFVRACALHRLGRDGEAATSAVIAGRGGVPESAVDLYLCLGRPEAARDLLIALLERETVRDEVAEFVQIDDDTPYPSDFGRSLQAGREALRGDPRLLEQVRKYARVLHYSRRAGAPAEAPAQ